MRILIYLFYLTLIFSVSCVSVSKTEIVTRNLFHEIKTIEKKSFSKILVQWKNYPYSDYHKVRNLEKESIDLKPVEVNQKDYIKLKEKIITSAKEFGLYDELKGSGTIKILLLTYGRWEYGELIKTYLTDTPYIFIFPSSLGVSYKMIALFNHNGKEEKIENEGYVKTTFFLPLFPLYPLMTFRGSENTTLSNLIDKTFIDIIKKLKTTN
ncbi:MAG: hypothetical protein N2Z20_05980 [Elusimicrobiales bacterium]|nr:hypothetical protein [Elusimicrobiales bacterium]